MKFPVLHPCEAPYRLAMRLLLVLAIALAVSGCARGTLEPRICYVKKADTLVFKNAQGDTVALSIVPPREVCR